MEVGLLNAIEDLRVHDVLIAQVADDDAVRALTRALHHGRGRDDRLVDSRQFQTTESSALRLSLG